jgi:radical SAM family uncharacterized protein/radical SAM-linked protein
MRQAVSQWSAIDEHILPFVSKPSRYLPGEWNSVAKDPAGVAVRVALAFPDAYEIGMSHAGLKILYQLLNERPEVLAERVYAPWRDAEALFRRHAIPLSSHESSLPLESFDILGFTLQYELSYTTLLTMLELGGIPLLAAERDRHPLVVAGGPVAVNPEPLAPFVDAFLIGDGEEAVLELVETVRRWKETGGSREGLLLAVKGIPGMYVPALHQPGEVVRKRTALRLDGVDPGRFPVAYMEIVHDRAGVEVMRGCGESCRFCQAGYLYRPVRELDGPTIERLVERTLAGTGYEEISLASLSIADLSCLKGIVPSLMARLAPERVSLSLPSLRVEALNRDQALAEEIGRVRKTGLTIAPEAGSARLRRVINKNGFDEAEILTAVQNAARAGWESVKFYFMIGLPTETQGDLDELVRVARAAAKVARGERARGFGLTVSAGSFVPKPHTPFQWFAQDPRELLSEKQAYLKGKLREARIAFKWHQVESSFLEAVFSLGGREVAPAIVAAQRRGCRFDGWTEELRFDDWMAAFEEAGVDPGAIANRPRGLDDPLPWDHIDCGPSGAFLRREYRRALEETATADCHAGPCSNCGEICVPNWRSWAERIEASRAPDPEDDAPSAEHRAPSAEGRAPSAAEAAPETPDPGSGVAAHKIRFEYQKVGALRYLSHLEVMRALARALRRARLPLAYSQGFNPQPRLSLAQALAVGVAGLREPGEVELAHPVGAEEVRERWNAHLPPELKILRTWEAPLHGSALSAGVRGAVYRIQLTPNGWEQPLPAALGDPGACAEFAARDSIPVEVTKKGQTLRLDARPLLQGFAALSGPDTPAWEMRLRIGPTGSVKPQAVMRSFLGSWVAPGQLDQMVSSLRITRTALAFEGQG